MKDVKIAVVNYSGNTGKSTLSMHALLPRLGADLISVESINNGLSGERLRGEQFAIIQDRLLDDSALVLDVGASNVEAFFEGLAEYQGSHEDIHVFVVPVVPETKQQIDSIETIKTLAGMGVGPSSIRVVFNRVEKRFTVRDSFPAIIGFHAMSGGKFTFDERAVIPESEVFDLAKALGRSLIDLAEDRNDYKAALATAGSEAEQERIKLTIRAIRLARPMAPVMDNVFSYITA